MKNVWNDQLNPQPKGDINAVNYFIAQDYVKAFGELAKSPNQKLLMLPVEASSLIGSIAGVAEIAKEAFGQGGGGAQRSGSAQRGASVPKVKQ